MVPRCHHLSLLREMEKCISLWWLFVVPKRCMSSWSFTTWPLTALRLEITFWICACLDAHRCALGRALALHMFDKCHIAPSHRRLAHPSWVASMKLMLDLLIGAHKKRYLCSRPFGNEPAQVYVRGFSAGSYSGICLLHILWSMPHVQVGAILGGIALPLCCFMVFRLSRAPNSC